MSVFLVLLEGPAAPAAADWLERLAEPGTVQVLVPPVSAADVFAGETSALAALDAWWEQQAPAAGRPVVLTAHQERLPDRLARLDADFVVAVPDSEGSQLYAGLPNASTLVGGGPGRLAELALRQRGLRQPAPARQAAPAAPVDPFHLLAGTDRPAEVRAAPEPQPPLTRRSLLGAPDERDGRRSLAAPLRQLLAPLRRRRWQPVGEQLGWAVLARKPLLAAVVSRKGGVGKTASAAAVAALLGEAVDPFGHTAALVDANIGNPDAWGRLEIRGEATTMRVIVARLLAGEEPPSPAYAETPALAVYPESREVGDGYAPAHIQRVSAYLKCRHAAIVVDLPNGLPAFSSAEAAVAAAWIGEADVVVVPTTADPAALLGVTEYLASESVRGKPVVVPYIVPRLREIRRAPEARALLDRIEAEAAVVEVPDDDRATLALVRRTAITEVGSDLRHAYVTLATRVVQSVAERRDGGC